MSCCHSARSAQNYGELRRETFIYSFGFYFGLRLLLIFESNRMVSIAEQTETSRQRLRLASPPPRPDTPATRLPCFIWTANLVVMCQAVSSLSSVPLSSPIYSPLRLTFPHYFPLICLLTFLNCCCCFSSITVGGLKQKTWATNFAVNQQGTKRNLHKTTGRSTRPTD